MLEKELHPWAEHYRYLLKHKRIKAVPNWFHNRPVPAVDNLFWWNAFWELSSERLPGMGNSPIPGKAIRDFIRDNDLDTDFGEMLHRIIRAMDSVFLRLAGKKPIVDEDD